MQRLIAPQAGNQNTRPKRWPALRGALLLSVLMGLLTGCALHYDMTLQNGDVIRAKTKPKLDHGFYVYKDLAGKEREINAMRIRQIEAVRPGSKPSRAF